MKRNLSLACCLPLVIGAATINAADLYFDSDGSGVNCVGNGPWNTTSAYWSTAPCSGTYSVWPNNTATTATFQGTATASEFIDVTGAITVNKITNLLSGGGLQFTNGNKITFGGTSPTVHQGGSTTMRFTCPIGGGAIVLTKTGAGRLELGNNADTVNKYVIKEGIITTANTNKWGTAAGQDAITMDGGGWGIDTTSQIFDAAVNSRGITVNAGGGYFGSLPSTVLLTLKCKITGPGGITFGAGAVSASYSSAITNLLNGTQQNDYLGGTTITVGTLQVGDGGPNGSLGYGPITNNGTLTFNTGTDCVITNEISGSGRLNQNGTNTLTLTAANSYQGDTTMGNTNGVLRLAHSSALGGGNLTLLPSNNATGRLELSNNISILSGKTLTSAMRNSATPAIENISGNNEIAGAITVTSGGANCFVQADASTLLTLSGGITLGSSGSRTATLQGAGNGLVSTGAITDGAGTLNLTKAGTGAWTLDAANSYSGNTAINAGTLVIGASGSIASSPILTLAGGTLLDVSAPSGGFALAGNQMLQGSGTVTGNVATASGTRLNPGSLGVPATLTFSNDLSLATGTTNYFDLALNPTIGSGTNDLIAVGGALNPGGATIGVSALGPLNTSGSYRVFNYAGGKTGSFDPVAVALDSRYTFSVDESTANQINVTVSGSPASLVWSGGPTNAWDVNVSANWNNDSMSFLQADKVTFDDTSTSNTVAVVGTVYPSSITVKGASNYVFQGSGKISGPATLTKDGPGMLTLSNANTFSGLIVVSNGTLQAGNASSLGSTNAGTEIRSGATLDINGISLYNPGEYVTIAGAGLNNTGAVINTAAQQQNALRAIGLAANASIGAWSNRWDLRGPGGNNSFSGLLDLNGYTLTKLGTGKVVVADCVVTNAGSLLIAGGILDLVRSKIDGSGYINVSTNVLEFENNSTGYVAKAISVNGGTIWSAGTATGIGAPITNLGPSIFQTDSALTLSNGVSGAGSLTKAGTNSLTLLAANTYSGSTVISSGTLALSGTASIAASSSIIVSTGATLSVTGRVDSTLTLSAGQTLAGSGTVSGNAVAGLNTVVSPGSSIGTLTITSNLTLAGTTVMEVDAGAGTNDLITGMDRVTYGGTLVVSNISLTQLAAGTLKLFNATNYSGVFSAISPTIPGPNLLWNTNSLALDGTLKITATVVPRPVITGFTLSGTGLVFSGTNGAPNSTFYLLGSTNVAQPVANWQRLATNAFNASGFFNITNAVSSSIPRQFYLLLVP
jgi:fibronectin-binding autotransporter adhesin